MPDRTCSIEGCEGPYECRGYCGRHYQRWRKYGDPLMIHQQVRQECTADGCGELAKGHGLCQKHYVWWRQYDKPGTEQCGADGCDRAVYARGWCKKHYERVKKHGDPNMVLSGGKPGGPNKGVFGADHPQWRGDEAGYKTAHTRVTRLRGRAKEHSCAHCGGPAKDWAFDGERTAIDVQLDERGYPYSFNPDYYVPLCASCHRQQNPGRPNSRKTHCPQGHPYDEVNTYWVPGRGKRACRICLKGQQARAYAKRTKGN